MFCLENKTFGKQSICIEHLATKFKDILIITIITNNEFLSTSPPKYAKEHEGKHALNERRTKVDPLLPAFKLVLDSHGHVFRCAPVQGLWVRDHLYEIWELYVNTIVRKIYKNKKLWRTSLFRLVMFQFHYVLLVHEHCYD